MWLAGAALTVVLAAPGRAEIGVEDVATVEDGGSDDTDAEILVFGRSYGRVVGKTLTPLKDVPNTVTLVDREQIEAQNLFTLEDALTATNGITINGVGSEDPSFLSRGFAITNYLVDGVPTMALGFPGVVPDLLFYERLEVLRGPAGLFSGSGNPAGSINLVRKRPLGDFRMHAALGYGSYDNLRAELDVSASVSDRIGVRVGAMVQNQDQFFDVAHRNRIAAYGIGAIEIGDQTTLTVGVNYDRFKPAIQSGLPGLIGGLDGSEGQLLDIDRSTYLGADWNRFQSDTWSAFAELAHRISDRWNVRATGLVANVDRIDVYSYIGNQPVTATNGVTHQIAYRGDSFQRTRSFDVNGVGTFSLFGRDQTLIVGADYQARDGDSYFTRLSNFARIDVYDLVSPAEPPLDPYGPLPVFAGPAGPVTQVWGGSYSAVEQYGLYGQARLSPVEGLTLVGGGRLTWWDTDNQTLLPTRQPETGYGVEGQFSTYAGIVWDITANLNLYASYADSFTPQAAPAGRRRPDGAPIAPLIGDQYELGTKLSLMDDRLLLSLAGYQLTQSNRLFNDPDLADIVLQIGQVRARGLEADVIGQILPGWRINGGYSYTRTKYLEEANPVFEGLPLVPVVPEHMLKLFSNYEVQSGPLSGASLGAGVTWFSETWGGTPAVFNADGTLRTRSSVVRQDPYAIVDLSAGYRLTENISLALNVNNLLDKTYFARISSTGRGNYYGSPRTVMATVRFTLP